MPPQGDESKGTRSGDAGQIPLRRAEGLVLVMDTPKGRGVFANKDIPGRTVIEVSPVLVLDPTENSNHICKTVLYNYTYNWPYTSPPTSPSPRSPHTNPLNSNPVNSTSPTSSHSPKSPSSSTSPPPQKPPATTQAVIFGLGSMFNHSNLRQNVGWERDLKNLLVTYTTLRDIKKGEELCISYGARLTFKDTEEVEEERDPDDWTEVMNIIDLID